MGFFLPSFWQKRILRFALSHVDLLDIDALDLDNLDIAIGKRSTVELKSISIRLDVSCFNHFKTMPNLVSQKLSSLLQLPSHIRIINAHVALVRLHVPADIYNSGIFLEVEGVCLEATAESQQRSERSRQHGTKKRSKGKYPTEQRDGHDTGAILPTTTDLAQSFLRMEPEEEKEQLKETISISHGVDQSQLSEARDEDAAEGLGDGFSMPGFVAGFLSGVVSRIHATVKDVRLDISLTVDVSSSTASGTNHTPTPHPTDTVILRLSVSEISVGQVTAKSSEKNVQAQDETPGASNSTLGNRRISIHGIHGTLLSDASVFSWLAQYSGPPSPSVTHSGVSRRQERTKHSPPVSDQTSSSSETGLGLAQSSFVGSTSSPPEMRSASEAKTVGSYIQGVPGTQESLSDSLNSFGDDSSAEPQSDSHRWNSQSGSQFASAHYGHYSVPTEDQGPSSDPGNSPVVPRSTIKSLDYQDAFSRRLPSQHGSEGHQYIGTLQSQYPTDNLRFGFESQGFSAECVSASAQILAPDPDIFDYRSSTSSPDVQLHLAQSVLASGLTESRLFSHEEAASMYQSAVSHATAGNTSIGRIPGQWAEYDNGLSQDSAKSTTPTMEESMAVHKQLQSQPEAGLVPPHTKIDQSEAADISQRAARVTHSQPSYSPTKSIPSMSSKGSPRVSSSDELMAKIFFSVDIVTIDLPEKKPAIPNKQAKVDNSAHPEAVDDFQALPGGFSQSSISTSSRIYPTHAQSSTTRLPRVQVFSKPDTVNETNTVSISIRQATLSTDMGLTRLALIACTSLSQPVSHKEPKLPEPSLESSPNLFVEIESLSWNLLSSLKASGSYNPNRTDTTNDQPSSPESEVLLSLRLEACSFSQRQRTGLSRREMTIGRFTFGYEDAAVIDFDSALRMRESTRDVLAPKGQDVKITAQNMLNQPTEMTIMTLPIHVNFDLTRLDETFSWFGGLSGMLELGNSMVSTVTITDPRPRSIVTPKEGRAVRFESPIEQPPASVDSNSTKVTARIGGLVVDVHGKDASVMLEGSAVKVVVRAEGIGVRVDKLKFSGPLPSKPSQKPAITAQLDLMKLEYIQLPTEDDLGRLLALLSPSSERGEADDDILLDTFLRQRRQGGVLRVSIEAVRSSTGSQHEFSRLLTMSDELRKLSTVAKYLPEDDRPGILTLAQIRSMDLDIEVGQSFGSVSLHSESIEVGHVSFPSLFLLGVGTLGAQHNSHALIGPVLMQSLQNKGVPSDEIRQQPTITARFIGDALEPTLKVRLWNLRLDYHVSMIMAILGITETASGEIVVNELVQSVANIAAQPNTPKLSRESSNTSNDSSLSKSLKFEISIRDTAVSLNPRASPAQALLVFTCAQVSGNFPKAKQPDLKGSFDIKKMSILIVDDTANIQNDMSATTQSHLAVTNEQSEQLEILQLMGFVSVSEISSASIGLSVIVPTEDQRCIEIDIRDDLFVLETCADSSQTLQTILGGLGPPMPPSKELKYRTEVVPVQDMLASFTGGAFATDSPEDDDTDYQTQLNEVDFVDDEVSPEFEVARSFYDPDPDPDLDPEDDLEASSLESSIADSRHSGALLTELDACLPSFHSQDTIEANEESFHIDDHHFSGASKTKGGSMQWNSNRNAFEPVGTGTVERNPFRLRLRDVHVIWNLFDGYDWQRTRDMISQAVAEVETKAAEKQARRDKRKSLDDEDDEDSVIGDFLFNSIYIGVGVNQNPRDLARQVNRNLDDLASEAESYATTTATALSASPSRQGISKSRRRRLRLQRSKHHKMTFELKGVAADVIVLPPGSGETQSSIDLRIHDFEVFDHVPTSTWKKFATYMHDAGERESGASMAHIELLNVKPDPELAASEIVFKATILPLRLHVDQDALDFITRFFEFKDDSVAPPTLRSEVPFIQRAEVKSIPIKLDFKPKRVDYSGLRSGRTSEFMNFIVLDSADLVLRHAIIYGVSGFDKLGKTLNDIWTPDVKRNQLPGVLAGLAPVRSLVNVGSGVRDLVVIPMREYRKDGRVMRSIQKGALAFAKTTTTELTKLGAKLAVGTQTVLQNAEGVLVPKPESSEAQLSESPPEEKPVISPYADPPVGVVQGLRGGYRHLERDLLLARDAIVAMPGEVMESGSAGGAAKAVLKGAPTVVLRPALGVTKAVGQALMGATSALDKGERRRLDDKYKRR
ncbi:MAG: autophagy- protein 2 [Stictis urceolatum]|nr:autophagy- protein 2 [Stictis urceolata]